MAAPYFTSLPHPLTGNAETHRKRLQPVARLMFEINGSEYKSDISPLISALF
jgi:hypothetical protein